MGQGVNTPDLGSPGLLAGYFLLPGFPSGASFRGLLLCEVELALDAAGAPCLLSLCASSHFLLRIDTTFQQPLQMLFLKMFSAKADS